MRLVFTRLCFILASLGGETVAEPIIGSEYRCGSEIIYFGSKYVFYNAPGVYEDTQPNTSIVEGIGGDRFRFRIPYGSNWHEVRQLGCGSTELGICEREYAQADLDGDVVTLRFRVVTEFRRSCPNLNDCRGMQAGIFFTLRDNRIAPAHGYVATFENVTVFKDFWAQKDYYFQDTLGNSFHNNMYRHLANRTNWRSACSN